MLASGLIYAGLAIYTFKLLFSSGGGGGSGSTQSWTAKLMSEPAGTVLVALIGAAIFIYGGVQLYKAITANFMKKMKTMEMNPDERKWSERISRLGLAARGVVFFVIGGFFFWAAIRHAPEEARGLEGALQTLGSQPYGNWILGAVAIGLVCYGAYNWVESRWRKIGPHKPT
jgi:TRAP-type C4-dicarboxylate transport system permease small subunit